jgi:alcohol dehydrogenase/propanol-preferring alcohol dehydrogenase
MKSWAVVAHKAPLECIEIPDLVAAGSEVVVEVTHCGVCHSDLHLWHGGYDLGGGRMLLVKDRGLVLPAAPGHEIVGRVIALGPDAAGVAIGDRRVVYPWIGCGRCGRCAAGDDNLCTQQRSLGVAVNGGFAQQVKVPHPRYLLSFDGVDAATAATYACSGLTAYSAVQKLLPLRPDQAVVVIGAGGVGLAAIAVLRALGHGAIIAVDLSADKRSAALAAGADEALDGASGDIRDRLLERPIAGLIDFVGSNATAELAAAVLPKGGTLILVGIGGGELTLSVAGTIFRAHTIRGSLTGSIAELRAVLDLAAEGRLAATPVREMPKDQANAAMAQLEAGQVTGRLVLTECV